MPSFILFLFQLRDYDVNWIINDSFLGSTFFDASASEFLLNSDSLESLNSIIPQSPNYLESSSNKFELDDTLKGSVPKGISENVPGAALGPNWAEKSAFVLPNKEKLSSGSLTVWFILRFLSTND